MDEAANTNITCVCKLLSGIHHTHPVATHATRNVHVITHHGTVFSFLRAHTGVYTCNTVIRPHFGTHNTHVLYLQGVDALLKIHFEL